MKYLKLPLLFMAAFVTVTVSAERPNVIVVMTDDQGYGELSVHGNPILKTPHLDRLHSQSVRLTDFHVAPMCTPTRGQLLTGVDAAQNATITPLSPLSTLNRTSKPFRQKQIPSSSIYRPEGSHFEDGFNSSVSLFKRLYG